VVSAEPRSGPTVEIRSKTFVFLPMVLRKLAEVMSVQSWVTSNSPYALYSSFMSHETGDVKLTYPAALAWTTLESFLALAREQVD
jgi:hypothetical protein